jgi:hypothetical protein
LIGLNHKKRIFTTKEHKGEKGLVAILTDCCSPMHPGLVAADRCSPMHPGKIQKQISIDYDNLLCHKALHYFLGDISFFIFFLCVPLAPLWFLYLCL